jgi:metallo-beta-lactamase class B
VPLIRASVEKLGFKFADVKVLLISHAHADHCAGSAEIKKLTGARYMVMEGDVPAIESGGAPRKLADYLAFPPAKVDRVLKDGDEVKVGDSVLVAHLTPGHTRGCTTWTMQVRDGGKSLDAVIIGSPNVNPGYILVNNKTYPEIATDYEKCFRVLHSLPVDVFLGAHWQLLRHGKEARAAVDRCHQYLHRSRRLPPLCDRARAGFPRGVGQAKGQVK